MQPHQSQRRATHVAFSVPGPSVFPKALYGGITTSKSTGQKQRGEGKMGERGGGRRCEMEIQSDKTQERRRKDRAGE